MTQESNGFKWLIGTVIAIIGLFVTAALGLGELLISAARYDHEVKEAQFKNELTIQEAKTKRELDVQQAKAKKEHDDRVLQETHRTRLAFTKSEYIVNVKRTRIGWAISDNNKAGDFPSIRNVGVGPAIDVKITYHEIKVNDASYYRGSEAAPTPMQIATNEEARLMFLPLCLHSDVERKIKKVEGRVFLQCKHRDGGTNNVSYDYVITTCYDQPEPHIHLSIKTL